MRFENRGSRIEHLNDLHVIYCVSAAVTCGPGANQCECIVANHVGGVLRKDHFNDITIVRSSQSHGIWNGGAIHHFISRKGLNEGRSIIILNDNGKLVIRGIATLIRSCQCDDLLVVSTPIRTECFACFTHRNFTTIVGSRIAVWLLLTFVCLIRWYFGKDRRHRILNLDNLNMLRRIATAIRNRPCACNGVGLSASTCLRCFHEIHGDLITVVHGREGNSSGNGIAFNRCIAW